MCAHTHAHANTHTHTHCHIDMWLMRPTPVGIETFILVSLVIVWIIVGSEVAVLRICG